MQKLSNRSRKGDTGHTSSQGRKLASGGAQNKKKGNPDINEDTRNEVKDEKPKKLRVLAGAVTR